MSVTHIPDSVKFRLWGKAGGRCEYDGCNQPLWIDSVTKHEFNTAYIAHIIADKPGGPRGHEVLSEKLKDDILNLMLMCDQHHRLIDKEDVDGHPVALLQGMKKKHENRIELLTSLFPDKQSHVLIYGANIGEHSSPLRFSKVAEAMLPERYPAQKTALELSLLRSPFIDREPEFWDIEREQLLRQFERLVRPLLVTGDIKHLSIFGLAPQPLLIELGRLLSDIQAAEVFQLHREPANWMWQDYPEGFRFFLQEPRTIENEVAINLSLSATIDKSRIHRILGEEVSIWTLTVEAPNNDFLKSRHQLGEFRQIFRQTLEKVKLAHGEDATIHLFPAVPVAVAIEVGRAWMPKADLPLQVYDENKALGGFIPALEIGRAITRMEVKNNG